MELDKHKAVEMEVNDIENVANGITIDFSKYEKLKFKAANVRNCTLTGKMTGKHSPNGTNFVFCKISDIVAKRVDFTAADFKDSHFINSSFEKCKFNESAIINNLIDSVTFMECSFSMTAITGTQFHNTTFKNCDFRYVVINSCQFISCWFENCKTSNKVIEMSFLYDSYFYETDIFLETILENFGINHSHLRKSYIQLKQKTKLKGTGLKHALIKNLSSENLTNIEKFKIDYFLEPNILIEGSEFLDTTFNYEDWIELCAIPKSFSLLLENYCEFLLKNFDENKLPVWGLLKLHSMTGYLLQQKLASHEVYRSISGVHLSLSRFVEQFLELLTQEVLTTDKNELILLVEGPLDKSYYLEELAPYFASGGLSITKVVKHNSPNELVLSWVSIKDILPIIAVFLATRFKVEFENLKKKRSTTRKTKGDELIPAKASGSSKDVQSFSLELGFDKDESFLYQLKLKVLTPGDLLLNLQLGFNTKLFGKLKRILVDILSERQKK